MHGKNFSLSDPEMQRLFAERAALRARGIDPGDLPGSAAAQQPPVQAAANLSPPAWATEGRPGCGARGPQEKYGFRALEVGGTFRVSPAPDRANWQSFRNICSYKGKLLGRKFRCHRYPDGTYEVWRER